jgi:hypothetical protein
MHSRDQNGEAPRLPGRDQHHHLQGNRHGRGRAAVRFPRDLGVDGHTITPGYEYDAAKKDMIKRLNLQPENFFLTRKATVEKFAGWRSG